MLAHACGCGSSQSRSTFCRFWTATGAQFVTALDYNGAMNRRQFLQSAAASVAATVAFPELVGAQEKPAALPEPTLSKLPRWRGVNLLEWVDANNRKEVKEGDFAPIGGPGF